MLRTVLVPISLSFLQNLLQSKHSVRITKETRLPNDAKLIGVELSTDLEKLNLLFESPSLPEHEEGSQPVRIVRLTREEER